MTIQPSQRLLLVILTCCLHFNVHCRRYDRCSTREGRSGICVAKRFCREAVASPRQALTACSGSSGFYCCPVPTARSSENDGSSNQASQPAPLRPTPSSVETSTYRREIRYPTSDTNYRPGSNLEESGYASSSSSEGTYRYPDKDDSSRETRVKEPDSSDSGSRHQHDGVRLPDRNRPSTKRPRYEDQDRKYVTDNINRRPAVQRPTSSPTRRNDRPQEKHATPASPIKFSEEYKPPHPHAPACGQKPYELFIAGGEESRQHEWPWMAAVFRRHNSPKPITYICGGSLINRRYILTAAHCFIHNYVILPASTFTVRLGAHYLDSGEDYTVANLVLHHNHSGSDFFNDIALVRLASEVFFTDKIAPICLPTREMSYKTFVDRMATVAGWGSTAFYRTSDSRVLQHVSVPVLSNEECSSAYSRVRGAAFLARGTDHIVCAGLREGGKDACLGDSGGPLMLKGDDDDSWTVIGIVSLGYKCAEPGYPGVYTRVTHYISWIYSNMKN